LFDIHSKLKKFKLNFGIEKNQEWIFETIST